MSIRSKIKVEFNLEDGCSQKDGEVNASWQTINFSIYSNLFIDMIDEAIAEWLSDNTIEKDTMYEVIFAHVVDHDSAGAVIGEHFEPIYKEMQVM